MRPSLHPDTHRSPERKTCASPPCRRHQPRLMGTTRQGQPALAPYPPPHTTVLLLWDTVQPSPQDLRQKLWRHPRLLPSLSSADYMLPSSPTAARFLKNATGGCVLLSGFIGVCLNIQIMIPLSRTDFQQSALCLPLALYTPWHTGTYPPPIL